ncbi:MAG: hypothetical protein EGQ67_09420 [Clostridiales bacterium]|nr:hypothetical protein [Clostridiales bacterium]
MIAFCRTPRGKLSGRSRRNGMEPVNKDQYLLQSLDNALGVLSLFLQEDKLTLSQIAQRSGLNKTVAYRIVYTLEKRGYLNADREGRYRPGIQLAALGARAQMSRAAVELAKPVLTALSREINETVHFTRRYDACRATLLDEILPQQGLIAAVRREGYMLNDQMYEPGVAALGVPIFAQPGKSAEYAISISGPAERILPQKERIVEHLRNAARELNGFLA